MKNFMPIFQVFSLKVKNLETNDPWPDGKYLKEHMTVLSGPITPNARIFDNHRLLPQLKGAT